MATSLYFYDLETSGINPRSGRIMQFAGRRTDLALKPIGEPDNIIVKLNDDILPEPDAVMITGITPQSTQVDGITEVEFLKYFINEICLPGTIFVGFNNVRFDDEFIRHTLYRNFYDAYEWCWRDQRSRWDLLDVVRMTRALRPEGINWPFAADGKPTIRLELLTSINGLEHKHAHDALSDVDATISVARLIRNKQTKLFEYLLNMRDKNKVTELVNSGKPFLYTSGRYANLYDKTTIVVSLGEHPGKQGVLVYDLRTDPSFLIDLSAEEIAKVWRVKVEDETKRFPIKTLQFNRCPAVAPMGVLDENCINRLKIDLRVIDKNKKILASIKDLRQKLLKALEIMDIAKQASFISDTSDVDGKLYDGFFGDADKNAMGVIRASDRTSISSLDLEFKDDRLNKLFPLYKARNYPTELSEEERKSWEKYKYNKFMGGQDKSQLNKFFIRIDEISKRKNLTSNDQYLLEELMLYGQSLIPEPIDQMDE